MQTKSGAQTSERVGEVLQAGMFWRGSLAKAVKRRDVRGTTWGVLAVSAVLFFYVWQHMQVVKIGYEVEALRKERQDLTNQYYYLKYRLNEVKGLSRVEEIARGQLGMVTPKSEQVVMLNENDLMPSRFVGAWFNFMRRTEGK